MRRVRCAMWARLGRPPSRAASSHRTSNSSVHVAGRNVSFASIPPRLTSRRSTPQHRLHKSHAAVPNTPPYSHLHTRASPSRPQGLPQHLAALSHPSLALSLRPSPMHAISRTLLAAGLRPPITPAIPRRHLGDLSSLWHVFTSATVFGGISAALTQVRMVSSLQQS